MMSTLFCVTMVDIAWAVFEVIGGEHPLLRPFGRMKKNKASRNRVNLPGFFFPISLPWSIFEDLE